MNLKDVACTATIKCSFLYHFTFLNSVVTGIALSLFFQCVRPDRKRLKLEKFCSGLQAKSHAWSLRYVNMVIQTR